MTTKTLDFAQVPEENHRSDSFFFSFSKKKSLLRRQYRTAEFPDLSVTQWPVCCSLHLLSPRAELSSQSTLVWLRMDVFCVLMRSVCKKKEVISPFLLLFLPLPPYTQRHFTSCPNRKDMWCAEPGLPAPLTSMEKKGTHLSKPVQIKTERSEAGDELHLSVAGRLSFLRRVFVVGGDDAPVAGPSVYVVVGHGLRRLAELGHAFMVHVLAFASR